MKLVKIKCLEGEPRLMLAGMHRIIVRQGDIKVEHFLEEFAINTWNEIATTINNATQNEEVVK